jgi:hypothetical protein
MSQAADSRVKTVSGYRAGYPAATVTSRQAETLSLSDASWHWLALPGSAATAATRSCSLQPRLSRLPIMMSGHWALGCGHWAVGTGHLWAVGTQDRRATAVKVLTQTPHETGTSPSPQSLQDSDENLEARGRSVALNGTSRTAWPGPVGTEAAHRRRRCHSATVTRLRHCLPD